MITTAVVAINDEKKATLIIKKGRKTHIGSLIMGIIFWATQDTTPFFSRLMAIIIKHKMVSTALSEKPETASSGLTRLNNRRLVSIKNAVLSTVNFSLTNNKKAIPKIPNTMAIYTFIDNKLKN